MSSRKNLFKLMCVGIALTWSSGFLAASRADDPPATQPATQPSRPGWPTEEEVKAAVHKIEYDIRASQTNRDIWKVKDVRHDFHSVQFANETTEKQMKFGAAAQTVYPVKVLYTRTTEYQHKDPEVEQCGSDGVWFFYKDSFGNWTAKYGSE
jgi:hypothetical protein